MAAATVTATSAADGHSPLRRKTWVQWDAFQYIDQATHGWTRFRCYNPQGLERWCGNAAWFPAYPWLARLLSVGAVDPFAVEMAVSWAFGLATVVLIWRGFCPRVDLAAAATVVFAAFAPGMIYFFAPFPLSMLAFFSVLYVLLLSRERWGWAGIAPLPKVRWSPGWCRRSMSSFLASPRWPTRLRPYPRGRLGR